MRTDIITDKALESPKRLIRDAFLRGEELTTLTGENSRFIFSRNDL